MNNKGADQTARMRRLICAFVVHIWHRQGFIYDAIELNILSHQSKLHRQLYLWAQYQSVWASFSVSHSLSRQGWSWSRCLSAGFSPVSQHHQSVLLFPHLFHLWWSTCLLCWQPKDDIVFNKTCSQTGQLAWNPAFFRILYLFIKQEANPSKALQKLLL